MDKAVILARGLGTRMRRQQQDGAPGLTAEQQAMAEAGVKALVPIDRPFLDYVLSGLADAGYRRICLVIGPEHEVIRQYYGNEVEFERLTIDFAVQVDALGTADAVAAAEDFAADDPVLVINSDNYYPLQALQALREFDGPGVAVFERNAMFAASNVSADRLGSFAVVETDESGYLKRILEKPSPEQVASLPEPVGVSMNCWRFDRRIFEACKVIQPSPRGEYELPDAVQTSMESFGARYRVLTLEKAVLDMSSRDDISGVAERLRGQQVRL